MPRARVRVSAQGLYSVVNACLTHLVRNHRSYPVYGQEACYETESARRRRQGRWGWGTPQKKRPPPSVTGVPKPVLVVKPLLARLADRVIMPVAAGASCLHGLDGRAHWEQNQWRESLS